MVNKFFAFFLVLILINFKSFGSNSTQVSVITIGPYEKELYSAFGHSGIRFWDSSNGIDYFYNYGIFDFDQPNFYLNFLHGKLLYKVGKYNYKSAEAFYKSQNRFIKEQILDIDDNDKMLLFKYLEENVQPENSSYLYNYIFNNCATKIRDVLFSVFQERVEFKSEGEGMSFRSLMDLYLKKNEWGDLGIDICLGSSIDVEASNLDQMYLPDYLFTGLEIATLDNKKLVNETLTYIPDYNEYNQSIFSPKLIFIIVLLISIYISFRQIKYGLKYKYFDLILFCGSGLIGLLIIYLWGFTDHLSKNNFNILWASPINFILPFLFSRETHKKWFIIYVIFYIAVLISLLILWNFIPQNLNQNVLIITLSMILRLASNIIYINRNEIIYN
ncbi:MAG: hypothetical protein CL869_03120 [Cytophagia bacterium]|nr:hypothetical protein [Cytophagia bacterium]